MSGDACGEPRRDCRPSADAPHWEFASRGLCEPTGAVPETRAEPSLLSSRPRAVCPRPLGGVRGPWQGAASEIEPSTAEYLLGAGAMAMGSATAIALVPCIAAEAPSLAGPLAILLRRGGVRDGACPPWLRLPPPLPWASRGSGSWPLSSGVASGAGGGSAPTGPGRPCCSRRRRASRSRSSSSTLRRVISKIVELAWLVCCRTKRRNCSHSWPRCSAARRSWAVSRRWTSQRASIDLLVSDVKPGFSE
mmetsp:Transcript_120063/g.256207  ORF Transcript_120063/g.256207 Transcript_120063/m.256207 type:complete len:249 (-) Transcript_120063:466-1212(-)